MQRADDDEQKYQADRAAHGEQQPVLGWRSQKGEGDQRTHDHRDVDRRAHDAERLGPAAPAGEIGDHGVAGREEHRPAEGGFDRHHEHDLEQAVRQREANVQDGAAADRQHQHRAPSEVIGEGAAENLKGQAGQAGQAQDEADHGHRDVQAVSEEQRLEGVGHVDADDVDEDAGGQQPELRRKLAQAARGAADGPLHRFTGCATPAVATWS